MRRNLKGCKAVVIESRRLGKFDPKRYNVGVSGPGIFRERFLIRGPWCLTTAKEKARRLQDEMDRGLHATIAEE